MPRASARISLTQPVVTVFLEDLRIVDHGEFTGIGYERHVPIHIEDVAAAGDVVENEDARSTVLEFAAPEGVPHGWNDALALAGSTGVVDVPDEKAFDAFADLSTR